MCHPLALATTERPNRHESLCVAVLVYYWIARSFQGLPPNTILLCHTIFVPLFQRLETKHEKMSAKTCKVRPQAYPIRIRSAAHRRQHTLQAIFVAFEAPSRVVRSSYEVSPPSADYE